VSSFILDASVAAKWFLPESQEEFADRARIILDRFSSRECQLAVPDVFWAEMGNLLARAVRFQRITADRGKEALAKLIATDITTVPSRPLLAHAMSIALNFQRPFYDCEYVALAIESGTPLLTADERLVNALGARFPVQWLGSLAL
jgi:predicted nucleic acid-binding protein